MKRELDKASLIVSDQSMGRDSQVLVNSGCGRRFQGVQAFRLSGFRLQLPWNDHEIVRSGFGLLDRPKPNKQTNKQTNDSHSNIYEDPERRSLRRMRPASVCQTRSREPPKLDPRPCAGHVVFSGFAVCFRPQGFRLLGKSHTVSGGRSWGNLEDVGTEPRLLAWGLRECRN